MPRLLLHPGFHKTGTSSAQHFLWRNRRVLRPHVAVILLRRLAPAVRLCLAYSTKRNPLLLMDLAETLDGVFDGLGRLGDRHILITCEGLSGHLPGWPGVADYSAAAVTLRYLTRYLAERFPSHDTSVLMTLRAPGDWMWSAWRHHLLGQRLCDDYDSFAARLAPAADLAAQAEAVRAAVAPVRLDTLDLAETAAHRFGPGGALTDRLPLPHDLPLDPVGHGNRGPDADLARRFLDINRSALDDTAAKAEKLALAEAAGVGGWARGNV